MPITAAQPRHSAPLTSLLCLPSPQSALSHSTCSSYFVDPDSLAIGAFTDNEGKLNCPHCRAKLGSFTWSGEQCSCGRWVTPAFMFNKSKVDEKRAGQTTDGGRGGVALRPPVIVFKPQLDAGSSGGDSAVDEHKQMAEDDSKRQSISPLPQSI